MRIAKIIHTLYIFTNLAHQIIIIVYQMMCFYRSLVLTLNQYVFNSYAYDGFDGLVKCLKLAYLLK